MAREWFARTVARGAAACVAGAILAVTAGCSGAAVIGAPRETVMVTETVATVTAAPPAQGGVGPQSGRAETAAGSGVVPAPVPRGNQADLDAVVRSVSEAAGIAVTAVGGDADVQTAGAWESGAAWSTIKVPLAIAAARLDPRSLDAASTAITDSDNQAAEVLWNSLGGSTASASAVEAVLAEGGDSVTRVPSVHTRPGFSIFGQTRWSLAEQAGFGGRLPCLGSASRVVDLMGQIAPDQRWGIGRIPGARYKAGWGPGEDGGYLVRQFGIVPGAGGDVAVAIAVDASSFEAGRASLSTMADGLAPQLAAIPGGAC